MSDSQVGEADDGFLGRWSRLKTKAEVRSAPLVDDSESVAVVTDTVAAEAAATEVAGLVRAEPDATAVAEPQALTDADMPDVESLDESSDFSGFLSEKVSEQLRRKALRKLFQLPEFNIRDGLNEYDEDYSTFVPLGDTVTYQMKQFIERQTQQFKEALNEDIDDPDSAQSQIPDTQKQGQSGDQEASTEILAEVQVTDPLPIVTGKAGKDLPDSGE